MFKVISEWINKYAGWIAFFSALLLIISLVIVGYILFAILLTDNPSQFSYRSVLFVLAVLSIPLLLLMAYSSQKAQNSELSETIADSEENADYIISAWSIETLRAAGVPRDLIKCLKDICDNAAESSPPTQLSIKNPRFDSTPDSWLKKLEENLGETRVDEFIEIILKYTRRNVQKTDEQSA